MSTVKELKTNKDIKQYLDKFNGQKFNSVIEKSDYFGEFSTFYIGNKPVLQCNKDRRYGTVSTKALIDFPTQEKRKALEV